MKKFISNNIHWLLLILVTANMISMLIISTNSKQDIVALSFSVIAFLSVAYLAFPTEIKKRKERKN
ncbi:hypothetical protein [Virgibacillus doumboii]|uniref:hypothetical protein n=1 Tax=Virgibacillus doumboii TaxID=2697503 RepID=UPI0013E09EB2|nr:hypothetical protein [Virgibacillus doumboii]